MTRLPVYHETAGLGRAGWPRGDCLVLDEVHGLSPGCLHDRIRTLVERATRALSPLPPPDGLITPAEAARRLRCSVKTLNAPVAAGDVRYVSIGKGRKRPRKMFTPSDLDEFVLAFPQGLACMSLYHKPRSPFWYFEFRIRGHR